MSFPFYHYIIDDFLNTEQAFLELYYTIIGLPWA